MFPALCALWPGFPPQAAGCASPPIGYRSLRVALQTDRDGEAAAQETGQAEGKCRRLREASLYLPCVRGRRSAASDVDGHREAAEIRALRTSSVRFTVPHGDVLLPVPVWVLAIGRRRSSAGHCNQLRSAVGPRVGLFELRGDADQSGSSPNPAVSIVPIGRPPSFQYSGSDAAGDPQMLAIGFHGLNSMSYSTNSQRCPLSG